MWKDSETIIDYLNFDYIIDAVVKLVLDEDLSPSSIGLYVFDLTDGYLKDMKMPRLHYVEPFLNQSTKKKDFLLRLKEK